MSSDNPTSFTKWRTELDAICKREFVIDTADMGHSLEELQRYFRDGDTPEELSDHFGRKFNLTRSAEVGLNG